MSQKKSKYNESRLTRRGFVKSGLLGGLAAGALPAMAWKESKVSALLPPIEPAPFELEEATISDLADGMASGKYTARAIVEKYIARIEEIDRHGPSLRSVIEMNPDALSIADALDRERKEHGARGVLHGIPVLIKDNIDTADRMATTAGSLGSGRGKTAKRFVPCSAAAQGRSGHHGKDQPE